MRSKKLEFRKVGNRKYQYNNMKVIVVNRVLSERLYSFALDIVKFVKTLPRHWVALEIGRQLLHSGTSVDANYEEACGAFSKKEFTYKLSIAFREAKESHYWLRLLHDSEIVTSPEIVYLLQESREIRNILGKSVKTARGNKK
jgi:four helix bundle protein